MSGELGLFEVVAEAFRGLVDPGLGQVGIRWHGYGVKVWFGSDDTNREHYEAQVVNARLVDEASVLALEIGFHAEHRTLAENDAVLDRLLVAESRWRPAVGDDAVAGEFIGRPDLWRRVSEVWPDPDLGDPDLALDLALRLNDYVDALEPVLRST